MLLGLSASLLLVGLGGESFGATPADIQAAMGDFNRSARYRLPRLGSAHLDALSAGQTVRVMDQPAEDPESPRRASAFVVVPLPRTQVWVGCQDLHFTQSDLVQEVKVAGSPPRTTWYGLLDLPRPIADRQWMVEVIDNAPLALATGDRAWEHAWSLTGDPDQALALAQAGRLPGVDPNAVAEAVWTPVNQGAWIAIALSPEETLLGYHATSTVGGNLPEKLVLQWVHSGLERLLEGVVQRAREKVPVHYRAGHSGIVLGANGKPIPYYP